MSTKQDLHANRILESLYAPPPTERRDERVVHRWDTLETNPQGPGLPLPPPDLRMGYGASDEHYLTLGRDTHGALLRVLAREGAVPGPGTKLLEWGCATGRVLRHFQDVAEGGEAWGTDQDARSILWAKQNLSPPFRFVTCTALPHLPFEDNSFQVVYGISVFTHMLHLQDMWLMEFRRILAPGGYALFTIHDEHSWDYLATHPHWLKYWADFFSADDLKGPLQHDVLVLTRPGSAGSWGDLRVFQRSSWVTREWGRYLDVVAIEPCFEVYQTLVLLRKPDRRY